MQRPLRDGGEPTALSTVSVATAEPASLPSTWQKRTAKVLLGIIVVWFVGKTLIRFGHEFDPESVTLQWLPVFGSLLVIVCADWLQAMAWRSLLARMTARPIPFWPAVSIHTMSMLARYTPGKVALPLIRIAGSGRLGLSPRLVGSSVGIEIISWLGVGWFVGSLATLGTGAARGLMSRYWASWSLVALAVTVGGLAVLAIVNRNRWPERLLRAIRAEGQGPLVPMQMMLLHAAAWIGWALHGALLVVAIGGSSLTALRSGGFFVLAPIVGFLALVAPGGLGVREAVLSLLLTPAVGSSSALMLALMARGVTVVGDLLSWLLAHLIDNGARKRVVG